MPPAPSSSLLPPHYHQQSSYGQERSSHGTYYRHGSYEEEEQEEEEESFVIGRPGMRGAEVMGGHTATPAAQPTAQKRGRQAMSTAGKGSSSVAPPSAAALAYGQSRNILCLVPESTRLGAALWLPATAAIHATSFYCLPEEMEWAMESLYLQMDKPPGLVITR